MGNIYSHGTVTFLFQDILSDKLEHNKKDFFPASLHQIHISLCLYLCQNTIALMFNT